MARRSQNGPTISLFSFQDIVTSVTAILILLVLILTLELIARTCRAAAADVTQTRSGLTAAIAELESVLERLRASSPSAAVRRAAMPGTELEREERVLRDQVAWAEDRRDAAEQVRTAAGELLESALLDLQEQRQAAREQAESLATERSTLETEHAAAIKEATELNARTERIEREAKQLRRANAEKRGRLDERSRDIDDLPKPGTELVYRRPVNQEQTPWLLEISREGYAALRLGSGQVVRFLPGCDAGSQFQRWAEMLNGRRDYVLLLVRPSGIDSAEATRLILAKRHITFGLDFIGEEQSVHDATASDHEPSGGKAEARP